MQCNYKIKLLLVICLVVFLLVEHADAARKKRGKKSKMSMMLRKKETNAVDFIRLAVMRLIYGVASGLGFNEQISEALNGAFVPPGVDDYDDYGVGGGAFDGLLNRDDDDYY